MWTYDESELDIPRNQVRLKLGDVDRGDQQLQDEEIDQLLDETGGSVDAATFRAARALAARYSRSVDKWVGDLKILASQRSRHYLELSKTLAGSAHIRAVPSAGGVYVADKEAIEQDASLVQPFFRRGQHDNLEGN